MKAELSHRERVLRAIDHQEVDRIPCFYRAEQDVNDRVMAAYGLSSLLDIHRHFGSDSIQLFAPYHPYSLPELADVESVDQIYDAKWPDSSVLNIEECVKQAKEARDTGLAVYGGVWASIFTVSRRTFGEERYLIALSLEPELITALITRLTDFFLELNKAYLDACAEYVDVYYFGSDFGTQLSLFISPDMFRQFYKPSLTRMAAQAKEYGLKVMYHTCGAVTSIIPDLADCGIDILDPVQVSAVGMDPANLAEKYKGSITFHGGISTQTTLPFGTPEQVKEEVKRTIDLLGPTGFIIAPDQHMIGDTPIENIQAMFDAIKEYGTQG